MATMGSVEFNASVEPFQIECRGLADLCHTDLSTMFSSEDTLLPGLPDDIVLNNVWPRL